jgi:hypothetical protein
VAEGGASYWSNKPHNGYMYASDKDHGLDILRYTGEGGTRWPATAGPAEVQRSARQGVPYVPIARKTAAGPSAPVASPGAPAVQPAPPALSPRKLGRFRFVARLTRVPGRRGSRVRVTLAIRDRSGRVVQRLKVRRRAGRPSILRVSGVAVPGRYTWRVMARDRVLDSGRMRVKPRAGLTLPARKVLVAKLS